MRVSSLQFFRSFPFPFGDGEGACLNDLHDADASAEALADPAPLILSDLNLTQR